MNAEELVDHKTRVYGKLSVLESLSEKGPEVKSRLAVLKAYFRGENVVWRVKGNPNHKWTTGNINNKVLEFNFESCEYCLPESDVSEPKSEPKTNTEKGYKLQHRAETERKLEGLKKLSHTLEVVGRIEIVEAYLRGETIRWRSRGTGWLWETSSINMGGLEFLWEENEYSLFSSNKETTEQCAKTTLHYSKGGDVEWRRKGDESWCSLVTPIWNFEHFEYRIVPREWTEEIISDILSDKSGIPKGIKLKVVATEILD
jgi:hypothetical protein